MRSLLFGAAYSVDGFWLSLRSRNLSQRTIENYTHHIHDYLTWCKQHELDYERASKRELTFYLGGYAQSHAATTVYLALSVLRLFYGYMEGERIIESNPAKQLAWRMPRVKDAEPFTQEEMLRMYQACRSFREQAIYLLVAGSGLRRGEVFGIRRDHVDFDTGTVTVTGKGRKQRQIRPGPTTINALRQALWFDEDLCPFKSAQWVWWLVKDLAKRAGVRGRVYTHRFRHNFATTWLDRGGTVEGLMEVMGHESETMSLRYARAGRKQRALKQMEALDMTSWLLGEG